MLGDTMTPYTVKKLFSTYLIIFEQTERALGRIDVLENSTGYTKYVAMHDVDALSEEV
jgi:hypothetical protein